MNWYTDLNQQKINKEWVAKCQYYSSNQESTEYDS